MSIKVDLSQARAFLDLRLDGQATNLRQLPGGDWSTAFAFRREGRDYVIRFGTHSDDFARDRFAARFAGPALPIPRILEIGAAFDGFFAISERVFGCFIDDASEAEMRLLLPALFAALNAARLADISATTGFGGWDARGNASYPTWRAFLLDVAADRPGDRIHGWRERLAASPVGVESFDRAYARLQALAAGLPEERHVVHSDLLHNNVLVDAGRITGVLDWGCAVYGDFLYDLAWLCFWQPWYPAWQRIDFRAEAARHYADIGLDVADLDERLRACQIHIGLAGQAYQAFAGYRDDLPRTARRTLEVAEQARAA